MNLRDQALRLWKEYVRLIEPFVERNPEDTTSLSLLAYALDRKGDVLAIIEASEVGRAKGELLQAIVECELKNTNYDRVKHLDKSIAERLVRESQAAARQAEIHGFLLWA